MKYFQCIYLRASFEFYRSQRLVMAIAGSRFPIMHSSSTWVEIYWVFYVLKWFQLPEKFLKNIFLFVYWLIMYPAFNNFSKFLSVSPNSLRSGQWMVFVIYSLSRMQRKLLDYSERMWFPNLWTFVDQIPTRWEIFFPNLPTSGSKSVSFTLGFCDQVWIFFPSRRSFGPYMFRLL